MLFLSSSLRGSNFHIYCFSTLCFAFLGNTNTAEAFNPQTAPTPSSSPTSYSSYMSSPKTSSTPSYSRYRSTPSTYSSPAPTPKKSSSYSSRSYSSSSYSPRTYSTPAPTSRTTYSYSPSRYSNSYSAPTPVSAPKPATTSYSSPSYTSYKSAPTPTPDPTPASKTKTSNSPITPATLREPILISTLTPHRPSDGPIFDKIVPTTQIVMAKPKRKIYRAFMWGKSSPSSAGFKTQIDQMATIPEFNRLIKPDDLIKLLGLRRSLLRTARTNQELFEQENLQVGLDTYKYGRYDLLHNSAVSMLANGSGNYKVRETLRRAKDNPSSAAMELEKIVNRTFDSKDYIALVRAITTHFDQNDDGVLDKKDHPPFHVRAIGTSWGGWSLLRAMHELDVNGPAYGVTDPTLFCVKIATLDAVSVGRSATAWGRFVNDMRRNRLDLRTWNYYQKNYGAPWSVIEDSLGSENEVVSTSFFKAILGKHQRISNFMERSIVKSLNNQIKGRYVYGASNYNITRPGMYHLKAIFNRIPSAINNTGFFDYFDGEVSGSCS